MLHQELQGLPDKYWAPLVLCDLEGRTQEEAARELGWPKGSMAKRLKGRGSGGGGGCSAAASIWRPRRRWREAN